MAETELKKSLERSPNCATLPPNVWAAESHDLNVLKTTGTLARLCKSERVQPSASSIIRWNPRILGHVTQSLVWPTGPNSPAEELASPSQTQEPEAQQTKPDLLPESLQVRDEATASPTKPHCMLEMLMT